MLFESTLSTVQNISTTKSFLTSVSDVPTLESSASESKVIPQSAVPVLLDRRNKAVFWTFFSLLGQLPEGLPTQSGCRGENSRQMGETKNCSLCPTFASLGNQIKLISRLNSRYGHLDVKHVLSIKRTSPRHVPALWINLDQRQSNIN